MDFILKIWIWITFIKNNKTFPTEPSTVDPKMEYEIMSGSFVWEDEGLWECNNRHLQDAFKYVINNRMKLIAGPNNDLGVMRSKAFDEKVYKMAKKHFPDWIGFSHSRCSYDPELADRIFRIKKVEKWRLDKLFNE